MLLKRFIKDQILHVRLFFASNEAVRQQFIWGPLSAVLGLEAQWKAILSKRLVLLFVYVVLPGIFFTHFLRLAVRVEAQNHLIADLHCGRMCQEVFSHPIKRLLRGEIASKVGDDVPQDFNDHITWKSNRKEKVNENIIYQFPLLRLIELVWIVKALFESGKAFILYYICC